MSEEISRPVIIDSEGKNITDEIISKELSNNDKSHCEEITPKNKKWVYVLFYIVVVMSVLWIAHWILAGVLLLTTPFPERAEVQYMTDEMKDQLQAFSLTTYLCLLFVGVPMLLIMQVLAALIAYQVLFKKISKKYLDNFDRPWWKTTLWMIFTFFFIILPPFFIWYMFWPLYKYKRYQIPGQASNPKTYKSYKKLSRGWKALAICSLVGFYSVPLWLYVSAIENQKWLQKVTPNREQDFKEAYSLSIDKPNTMVFYFDRCHGAYWNQLLALDYIYFNKYNGVIDKSGTSFAELFPEFTSYINVLSLAAQTNLSNPAINASWYEAPGLKDAKLINPVGQYTNNFKNTTNLDQTVDNWFLNSYAFNEQMFTKLYGYHGYRLLNAPYYGEKVYQHNSNTVEFQNDLRTATGNNDIIVTDSTESAKTFGLEVTGGPMDDVSTFQRLGSHKNSIGTYKTSNSHKDLFPADLNTNAEYTNNPFGANKQLKFKTEDGDKKLDINLNVKNGIDSSFIFNHSFITHEYYSYVGDKDCESKYNPFGVNLDNPSVGDPQLIGRSPERQMTSMWFMLQKMKDICIYLKNLPYTGPHSDVIKNQYDNTNIYLISDHGNNLTHDRPEQDKLHKFLHKHLGSIFTKQEIKDHDYYCDHSKDASMFDNFLVRKPRKFVNLTSLNKPETPADSNATPLRNIYDTKRFLASADLMPIIESDLQKVKQDQTASPGATFTFDANNSWFKPDLYQELNQGKISSEDEKKLELNFNGKLIQDPLADANIGKLAARTIPLSYGDWYYMPDFHKFNIRKVYYFTANQSVLNDPNASFIKKSIYNPAFYKWD